MNYCGLMAEPDQKAAPDQFVDSGGQSDEAQLLASLGSWKWDIRTGEMVWADELYRILGLDKEAFRPTYEAFKALIHPNDVAQLEASREACIKGRRIYDCELRFLLPDGTRRTLYARGLAIFDRMGKPVRIIGTTEDITEKKRAQAWVRELGAIVESSDDAIFAKTPEGIITSWNKGAERIYGYTGKEVVGQHISMLISASRHSKAEETLGRLAKGEAVIHYETVGIRKGGQEIQVSLTISPIHNLAGRIVGISTVARDITEQKRVERELRESEERFRQLTENIGEVFWLADADLQTIIYASPAYETIWGRSRESLYTKPHAWFDALHPEDRSRVIEARKTRATIASELEYRIVCPDGTVRWIRELAFPVHDAEGRVIRAAGVAEDVTERRQLEMQLSQSQKMDAIGRLAAGVAHDFNNLLTVISGHSELLTITSPSDGRWRESVAEIRRATELATASIRQLLVFSRRQILEPKVLDLNSVVAEAEKMLRRLISEDVHLVSLLQPRLSPVRADLGQLNQVLLNLAVNSSDAMPQGGRLTLETCEVDLDETDAKVHSEARPGRYVLLTVTDTGCGMTPEVQARIFEPFFTTKAEGHGTGLGLSVVLGIIQQSGGYIEVESEPGVQTKFKIYLPAVQGSAADGLAQSAPSAPERGSETVLLVEDEEPVRHITTRLLESLGYRVIEAQTGEEALSLFGVCGEKIDLLMTDVVMPGIGGREVVEALQTKDPDLKVLFQSGYTDDMVVRRGILRAEVAFLKKPFTLDVLAKKVREALGCP